MDFAEISTSFSRDLKPDTILISDFLILKISARNFTRCSFALPSVGGDVRRILSTPSESSFTSFFEERGVTFIFKRVFCILLYLKALTGHSGEVQQH